MKDFTVSMALVDFIPVICFTIAAIILQRDLYQQLCKGAYALFSAGTIDICFAGGLKALYKLLYAAGVCDFDTLNHLFFPLQALGFLLAGLGILGMLLHKSTKGYAKQSIHQNPKQYKKQYAVAAPVVFSGTMIFVCLMVIGMACMNIGLAVISIRRKKVLAGVLFLVSMVCSMGMGYLSAKKVDSATLNWIAEAINVIGQASILAGAVLMHRSRMSEQAMDENHYNAA